METSPFLAGCHQLSEQPGPLCGYCALWAGAMPPSTSRRSKQDHCAEDGGEQRQPPPDAGADDDVADPSSAARRAGTGEEPGVSHRAHNESFCCDWVRALSRSNAGSAGRLLATMGLLRVGILAASAAEAAGEGRDRAAPGKLWWARRHCGVADRAPVWTGQKR